MLRFAFAALSLCLWTAVAGGAPPPDAPALPPGFDSTKIAGGLNSTVIAALPDGRILIGEKQGKVRVVKDDVLLPEPFVTINNVETNDEQGLDGMTVHPDFAKNGWVYIFYTVKADGGRGSFNRIARYTAKGDVSTGGETVIYETDKAEHIHNGGALAFGLDGKLLIASGEVTLGRPAQELNSTQGKVLRVNDDGSIPKDNPFLRVTQGKYQAIFAIGFRQPFKAAVQPGTGRYYLNVVSTANKESIFQLKGGENCGWPQSEGYTNDPKLTNPVLSYGGFGNCITGGAFCNTPKTQFPKQYLGLYFFMDYTHNWVRTLDPAAPSPKDTLQVFATKMDRPVDLCFVPDGTLYLLNRGNGNGNTISDKGTLWHVRYTGDVPPAKIAFISQPKDTFPGTPFSKSVSVAVEDAQGNVLPLVPREVSLVLGNKGSSTPLKNADTADGIATFADLTVPDAGKGYTLTATVKGLPPVTSTPFEVFAKVAKPLVQPSSGKFTGPITVRLVSPTPGTVLHYTTDGSPPTNSSPEYTEPFPITSKQTIRAVATKSGLANSDVTFAEYTVNGEKPYGLPFRPEIAGLNLPPTAAGKPPATLLETGVFQDLVKLQPKSGFVPYYVNSPLWSDGAQKLRWVGLPSNGKVRFAATGEWLFPPETILVKHFQMPAKENTQVKRLETRLLIVDSTGKGGYGLTYKWRADNSNADLVEEKGLDETLSAAANDGGKQVWHYPSRNECLACHTANASFVLGLNTRQLNGLLTYPGTRVVDNQLRTWAYLEMFNAPPTEGQISNFAQLVKLSDPNAPLETRIRSYLDANCAQCHRPGGSPSNFDARFDTPLAKAGVINGSLRNELGIKGSKVVVPNDLGKSMLYQRMISEHATQRMPPLARNVIDAEAQKAIEQWISGMDAQGKSPATGPKP